MDDLRKLIQEMQRELERETLKRREEQKKITSRLEKEMAEMTDRLEKEMEKTGRLERAMEEETGRMEKEIAERREKEKVLVEKTGRLEDEIKEEKKKRNMLQVDVDDLKQSTGDIASWIVAGVSYLSQLSFSLFFYSPISSALLRMVVNLSEEFRFATSWIEFKQN